MFRSPRVLQVPTFGSVSLILTLASKWGCDIPPLYLILGTCPRLGHKRGCKMRECLRPQAHPISVGKCKEMSPKHSQVTSIMKVVVAKVLQIFGTKVKSINLVQIGLSTYHEKGLKV
jgi:hypothetical protein